MASGMAYATAVTISNRSGADAQVWIEPWGDFVAVPAGAALRVAAEAEQSGEFEIEYGGDGVAVWAWPSSTVRCYLGDREVKAGAFSQPVPGVPPGTTTSGFLRLMLGRGE